MYTLHCTQKLLTRIRQPVAASLPTATTALGKVRHCITVATAGRVLGGAIDAAGSLVRSMYLAETPIGPMRGKSPGKALYDLVERSAGCIDIQ